VRETTSSIFWSPVPLVPILAGVSNPHRELCAQGPIRDDALNNADCCKLATTQIQIIFAL
jgi:hypothetical protein